MLEITIAIGMVLSLIFSETLGLTAGGIIVPGYIAFYYDNPLNIIGTLAVSIVCYFIIKFLSNFMIIYGKRRLIIAILLGALLGYLSKIFLTNIDPSSSGFHHALRQTDGQTCSAHLRMQLTPGVKDLV